MHQSVTGEVGERSSRGVSDRRSEGMVTSGSAVNDPPHDWSAFCELQGRVQRDGGGLLKGKQVGQAFCDKLDGLVAAGKFDEDKAGYLKNGVTMGFDLGLDVSDEGQACFQELSHSVRSQRKGERCAAG